MTSKRELKSYTRQFFSCASNTWWIGWNGYLYNCHKSRSTLRFCLKRLLNISCEGLRNGNYWRACRRLALEYQPWRRFLDHWDEEGRIKRTVNQGGTVSLTKLLSRQEFKQYGIPQWRNVKVFTIRFKKLVAIRTWVFVLCLKRDSPSYRS